MVSRFYIGRLYETDTNVFRKSHEKAAPELPEAADNKDYRLLDLS
jgi:hypothetical protein